MSQEMDVDNTGDLLVRVENAKRWNGGPVVEPRDPSDPAYGAFAKSRFRSSESLSHALPLTRAEFDRMCRAIEDQFVLNEDRRWAIQAASRVGGLFDQYEEAPFTDPELRRLYFERLAMELSLNARVAHYEEEDRRAIDPENCEDVKERRKQVEYHSMLADRALEAEGMPTAQQRDALRVEWGLDPVDSASHPARAACPGMG